MKADVYFNLHRKVWSIRDRKTGLVSAHKRVVVFPHGARLVVQPKGRERVLKTGSKNIHAFARGESPEMSNNWQNWAEFGLALPYPSRVTYNPKRADHFTYAMTGERIDSAQYLVMVAPPGEAPQVWAIPD